MTNVPPVGDVQATNGPFLDLLAAPVVIAGRHWRGMSHQLLHRRQVVAGVEQVAGKGTAKIVPGQGLTQFRFFGPLDKQLAQGNPAHALAGLHLAAFENRSSDKA
jgi:hypothetical protein